MHFLAILARPSLLSGSIISGSMGGSFIPVPPATTLAPPQLPLASPLAGHEAHIANLGAIDSDHPISAVWVLEISMRKCTMDQPLLTLYGPHIANI